MLDVIFFLHIPKTAGTSLIDALRRRYAGEDQANHIEGIPRERWADLYDKKFVSGHLFYEEVRSRLWIRTHRLVTVLREPYARLASHLRYMDRYNQTEFREAYEALPANLQSCVDRLHKVDFGSATSLGRFLHDLDPWSSFAFDNCQVRFLTEDPGPGLAMKDALVTVAAADLAVRRLEAFDEVGFAEDLPRFLRTLTRTMGKPIATETPRSNPSGCTRQIDVSDNDVRRAMEPRVHLDLLLYSRARRRAQRMQEQAVGHAA